MKIYRFNSSKFSLLLLLSLILTIWPLPFLLQWFRPLWLPLLVIFILIYYPGCLGITFAWFCGILMDVLNNSVLGEHALALVLTAYITLLFQRRLFIFSLLQQAICIFLLVSLYQLVIYLLQGIIGDPVLSWFFCLTPFVSLCVWPFIVYSCRQFMGIN